MYFLILLFFLLYLYRKKKRIRFPLFITFFWVLAELLFIEKYSYTKQQKLNTEIKKLNGLIHTYKKKCAAQKIILKNLGTKDFIQRFAREAYFMKKPGEDVFIIELDEKRK